METIRALAAVVCSIGLVACESQGTGTIAEGRGGAVTADGRSGGAAGAGQGGAAAVADQGGAGTPSTPPSCQLGPDYSEPSGACDGTVPVCEYGRTRDCPGIPAQPPGTYMSPYDAHRCQCDEGVWSCEVSVAAAACPPPG